MRLLLAVGWLVLAGGLGLAPGADWASRIEPILAEPIYVQAHWGLLVVDARSGETVFERNPDQLFVPASTTKLFTVAAAWGWLGPEHRFETALVRQGQVAADGTLAGDLILLAAGDPTLGRIDDAGRVCFADADHTYANGNETATLAPADPLGGVAALAAQVRAAGIRHVAGQIRVDDRRFEHITATGSGPERVTPILINDNLIDLVVTPTEPGQPATWTWRPKTALFEVEATVATVAGDRPTEVVIERAGPGKIRAVGSIAAGHAPLLRVQEVDDPRLFAATLLVESLRRAGVDVADDALSALDAELPDAASLAALPRVATLRSPPFRESARLILKTSHNLGASTLPLLVAAERGRPTLVEGFRLEREFLQRAGVAIDTISLGSGAGGSRSDRITPRAAVALLRYMAGRPDAKEFRETLPSLGVDGTLATVVDPSSPARGRVQAKTGTLLAVNLLGGRYLLESKALAGYATTESGRELVFAMFVNNTHLDQPADTAREGRTLGRICEVLVDDQ